MSFLISVFSRFVRLFCVAIGDLLIQMVKFSSSF
ncbi:unnamed protein product [Brassica oleracea]